MNKQRTDGADWLRHAGRRSVARSVTIKSDLDQRVVQRMREEGLTYSRIVEEALQALLADKVA